MGIVDFILNLAGLLLWMNWRSLRSIRSTNGRRPRWSARCAAPRRRISGAGICWRSSAGCWFCARCFTGRSARRFRHLDGQTGSGRHRAFRSAAICSAGCLLFSVFSFGLALGIFYLWLLLLSLLAGGPDADSPAGADAAGPAWTAGRAGQKSLLPFVGRRAAVVAGKLAVCVGWTSFRDAGLRRAPHRANRWSSASAVIWPGNSRRRPAARCCIC